MKHVFLTLFALLAIVSANAATTQIPYSQFFGVDHSSDKTVAKSGYATIDLTLTGTELIRSINIKNNQEGQPLAGMVKLVKKVPVITEGVDFIELNCSREGECVRLGDQPVSFRILITPGTYAKGLKFSICDANHRAMFFELPAQTIAPKQTITISKAYEPQPDLLFYEGFDTFVWGGDYVRGASQPAYGLPEKMFDLETSQDVTGYEQPSTSLPYTANGSAFFQSNNNDIASKAPVAKSEGNPMSDTYLASRGMLDWYACFRTHEHPGYVGIGGRNRGIMRTSNIKTITGIRSVKLCFDFCPTADFTNDLMVIVRNGGYVSSVTLDGKVLDLGKDNLFYSGTASNVAVPCEMWEGVKDAASKKSWHHFELQVDRATDGMDIAFMTRHLKPKVHGFFIDNIAVYEGPEMERGDLRVLYWNIQNGMWYDQPSRYENFVKWVEKYKPDVCVWCEASTIYYDKTNKRRDKATCYLPDNWGPLAARYGHQYSAVGAINDNFPQAITSVYPIVTLDRIAKTETPKKDVSHGAGVHQINVNGHIVNIVTMHTWPQHYAYGLPRDKAIREASAKEHAGDYHRQFEMQYVVDHTINDPRYAGHRDWLLMGDLNSRSRADQWHFKSDENTERILLCQDVIRNNTDMKDIIAETYPGDFMSSTKGNSRIDNMYASPDMFARVKNAMIVVDGWTAGFGARKSPYVTSFYEPSDHRPILVDFTFSK